MGPHHFRFRPHPRLDARPFELDFGFPSGALPFSRAPDPGTSKRGRSFWKAGAAPHRPPWAQRGAAAGQKPPF